MKLSAVDYEYLNQDPLPIHGDAFLSDGRTPINGLVAQADVDPEQVDRNYRTLATPNMSMRDDVTGVHISGTMLNADAPAGGGLMVAVPTWLSDPANGMNSHNRLLYGVLAASNPNQRTFIMSTPALFGTDSLPSEFREHMVRTGRFNLAGGIIQRALDEEGLVPTHLQANFTGARYVAGLASNLSRDSLEQVAVCDPITVNPFSVAKGLFYKEGKHQSGSKAASQDPYRDIPHDLQQITHKDLTAIGLLRHLGPSGISQKRAEAKAFGRGLAPLGEDLQDALDRHSGLEVRVITPADSEIAPSIEVTQDMLGKLRIDVGTRVIHLVVNGATTAFDGTHPSAYVGLLNHSVNLQS